MLQHVAWWRKAWHCVTARTVLSFAMKTNGRTAEGGNRGLGRRKAQWVGGLQLWVIRREGFTAIIGITAAKGANYIKALRARCCINTWQERDPVLRWSWLSAQKRGSSAFPLPGWFPMSTMCSCHCPLCDELCSCCSLGHQKCVFWVVKISKKIHLLVQLMEWSVSESLFCTWTCLHVCVYAVKDAWLHFL